MSRFSNQEIEEIGNNSFKLVFPVAKVWKHGVPSPKEYAGTATLWQDSAGLLNLQLICRVLEPEVFEELYAPLFGDRNPAGQLLGDDQYYAFQGTDMSGRVWDAERISLSSSLNEEIGGVVWSASKVKKITTTGENPNPKQSSVTILSKGDIQIPFNQFGDHDMAHSVSKCTMTLPGEGQVVLNKRKDWLLISCRMEGSDDDLKQFTDAALEGIGIASGRLVTRQIEIGVFGDSRVATVFSLNESRMSLKLVAPIPVKTRDDFADFQSFVACYIQSFPQPYQSAAGFWFRIISAFDSSAEIRALAIATSCEGMLHAYFESDKVPDAELVRQCREAMTAITTLQLGPRARDRIVNSLKSADSGNVQDALRALEGDGRLPSGFRKRWNEVRHKLAHANELQWDGDKPQKFVDETFSSLELFNRLLMLKIGYVGRLYCFSKYDWPVEKIAHADCNQQ